MPSSEPERFNLQELSALSGIPGRTIRYYTTKGLLPAPDIADRSASYSREHLEILETITALKEQFLPLKEIRRRLESPGAIDSATPAASADTWERFPITRDAELLIRSDRVQQMGRELSERLQLIRQIIEKEAGS